MLQYLKRQAMKLRSGLTKGIVLLLCLATLFSSAQLGGLALIAEAADGDTVTVTVNYVYQSNSAMVAQPYRAQIAKGAAFQKTIEVPYLFNYSIPYDQAVGLGDGIELTKNTVSNKYSLGFDLPAVNEDITVTLYYVAGKATYTVKHYYQNLEDGSQYTMDPITVELTGDIDAYTQAVADNKPGFRCKGIPQTTIAADGTTVVDIYYDREYYTVTFDVNGGINGPEPIYAKYGTKFNTEDITSPIRVGYKFMGWKDVSNTDAETLNGDVEITENVTYTAQWVAEKGQADYSIVLWGQNANDNEYSYLGSYEAWGNVGNQVTWNEDTLISHVHTDDCWELTCTQEKHTHSAACGLNCTHTHDLTCYGLSANASTVDPQDDRRWSYGLKNVQQYFNQLGADNGYVFYWRESYLIGNYDHYYLRLNNNYYSLSASQFNKLKGNSAGKWTESGNYQDTIEKFEIAANGIPCTHTHTDACYACGKPEHTHDSNCGTLTCGLNDTPKKYMRDIQPDSNLWNFKSSETVTVDANGSTVLNVYFDRTTFTLTFNYRTQGDWDDRGGTKKTEYISARWGANILDKYNQIKTNSNNGVLWSKSSSSQGTMKYTSHFEIMPSENATYYLYRTSGGLTNQMRYYCDDLNGVPQLVFSLTFNSQNRYFTVSEKEDYYEFEGFTINRSISAKEGDSCKDAKFSEPKAVTYTVHYYKQGTTEQVASDRTNYVMIGTTVTEKAKMGKELNLVSSDMQNKYYPTNTSTSVIINQIDQEIIFYYTEATNVKYTVYYQDANGNDLLTPKTETTEYSTVTEQYVPIPGYAPRQFSITQDLTANSEQNKIVFIYDPTLTTLTIQKQGCEDIDENQTFLFHVKGSSADPNTKDIDLTVTVHGNGQTTVTDLPVGDYTVTEETEWSWRYTPQSGAERKVTVGVGGLTVQYQNSRTQTQWLDGDNYSVNHFDSKNQ